ncbi:MAG: acyltransferase family protein [Bacilli bacterium]|nr:acyltransferase family protein [Bacilli bacterium]
MKKRLSNFELMRIISMFFIVLWHFLLFGKMEEGTFGLTQNVIVLLKAITLVHVNSFVLLTGYFNYDKKFKLSKVIKTNNSIWFYNAACILVLLFAFGIGFSKFFTFRMLLPIPRHDDYWFLVVYMLLYLLSPLLNMVINGSDKTKHKMIIVGLLIITIVNYVFNNELYHHISGGYSLFSFILLYFIGSYLHKYPIEWKKGKVITISLVGFFLLAIINTVLYKAGLILQGSSKESVRYFADSIVNGFTAYTNPCILFGSILYFIFFSKIEFSNKVVNFFGKYVLGTYLITQNTLLYTRIYKPLGFALDSYNYKHILIAVGLSISFVIICSLIEALRVFIFKVIYDLKISGKLRNKITKLFKKVNINW